MIPNFFKDISFVGATDSAVPCAILIDIARELGDKLSHKRKGPGLKIVFFDGEEAFGDWTATDSLYGSRHLAAKWQSTTVTPGKTMISMIELVVLLDLLGAESPSFYSMHQDTAWLFDHLIAVEKRLTEKKMIDKKKTPYFKSQRQFFQRVEDDHKPFMDLGVPALHIIPIPFPKGWHTPKDDRASLSTTVIDDLSKIFRVFVAEYLRVK